MTYYQRYIKIMPTTNKKNYPSSRLLFNYTGDEYETLDFKGTYNGYTSNQCFKIFSDRLYKYTDKFIQTNNVIKITDYEDYIFKLKYHTNTNCIGDTLYEHTLGNNSGFGFSIYNKKTPPDPFKKFEYRQTNKLKVTTNYSKSTKDEFFIGLYKFNEITKDYEYLPDSFYDKKKQMYYLYENIKI